MRAIIDNPVESERGRVRLGWMVAVAGVLALIAAVGLAVWATPPAWLLPVRRPLVTARRCSAG